MAAEDYALSTAICEAIKEFDSSLIVLALSGGQLAKAAQDMACVQLWRFLQTAPMKKMVLW